MFSMTTTELSTSMPMPRDRPARVMTFMSRLVKYMSTTANSTDSGMLMPTTSVGLTSLRKMASTMMASAAPTAMLVRMLRMMMVI